MDIFGIIYKAIEGLKKSVDGLLKNMDKALKKQDALLFADGKAVKGYIDLKCDILKYVPFNGNVFLVSLPVTWQFVSANSTDYVDSDNGLIVYNKKISKLRENYSDGEDTSVIGIMSLDLVEPEIISNVGELMVAYCKKLKFINSIKNTENITTLASAFEQCESLTHISDMPNTQNLIHLASTFAECKSLLKLPILNTSNVQYFNHALLNCQSLTEFPNWDFSKAIDLCRLAYGTTNIKEDITLSLPCTTVNVSEAFAYSGITGMDLIFHTRSSSFDVNGSLMFFWAKNLKYVNISNIQEGLDFGVYINPVDMFYKCTALETVTFGKRATLYGSANRMFYGCKKLTSVQFISVSMLDNPDKMFYNCTSLESLPALSPIKISSDDICVLFSDDNDGADSALTTIPYFSFEYSHYNSQLIIRASKLTDVGGIGNMSLGWLRIEKSPLLTRESCINIFQNAANKQSQGFIVLHKDAYNRLTPEDIVIATNKGWSVVSAN